MRDIELKPMVHNGMEVVRFKDTGWMTTMGLDGTTTNGTLVVKVLFWTPVVQHGVPRA